MVDNTILREAQLIMLDMLIEFDSICKKYTLKYWLDSGTLLGAIRHRGFIPWDDDIDISMPVEDYNRFIDIATKELSSDIFLQSRSSDNNFPFDYIKLRSNRAKIIEFHERGLDVGYHQGVFIDIFPMLTIEDGDKFQKYYSSSFELLRLFSAKSLHTPEGRDNLSIRQEIGRGLKALHSGWSGDDLKVIYSSEMPDISAWFDIDKIFPLKEVEFEGHYFFAPNNPHHYLENIYSFNYMTLPPEDKRVSHAYAIEIFKEI
jgi:lipopolysaccharide cholinephosphotransferase